MRTSKEIQAELDAAGAELQTLLSVTIPNLTKQRKSAIRRVNDLQNSFYNNGGIIPRLKRELAGAQFAEADAQKLEIRITDYYGQEKCHVVSRVTPKRIYTRERGFANETVWRHSGVLESRYEGDSRIHPDDLAKILEEHKKT